MCLWLVTHAWFFYNAHWLLYTIYFEMFRWSITNFVISQSMHKSASQDDNVKQLLAMWSNLMSQIHRFCYRTISVPYQYISITIIHGFHKTPLFFYFSHLGSWEVKHIYLAGMIQPVYLKLLIMSAFIVCADLGSLFD